MAYANDCYKVILDCEDHNQKFYEKCGFHRKGVEMACYRDGGKHHRGPNYKSSNAKVRLRRNHYYQFETISIHEFN